MATIHPIKKKDNAGIIAELEIATGKMAVVTTGGEVVLLKIPVFRKKKKVAVKKQMNVKMPTSIPFISLAKFAAEHGYVVHHDRQGNAELVRPNDEWVLK